MVEASGRCSKVKSASPADFDGNHKKGWAFLNSCTIYFGICGDQFLNDQARIYWALSFFKTDQAAHFADKVLHLWRKGKVYHSDWDAFAKDFTKYFTLRDEKLSAVTKLEGMS